MTWWMREGWTETRCAHCGAKIWPDGDPDWGLCYSCFNHSLDQREREREEQREHDRQMEAEADAYYARMWGDECAPWFDPLAEQVCPKAPERGREMKPLTPEEFKARMQEIAKGGDTEGAHQEADALMCELLSALGYAEGVGIFENMDKWYA